MTFVFLLTLLLVCHADLALGYSLGAPNVGPSCTTLIPRHGNSTATGAAPYNLSFTVNTYKPGDIIQGTLSGLGGAQFKGFFIVARRSNGSTDNIGNFSAQTGSHVVCSQALGNGVTHSNSSIKSSVSFNWIAPSTSVGDVVFHYTVVRGGAPNTSPARSDFFQDIASTTLKAASENSFFKNSECGKTRGCFSNCNNNECDLELSWRNVGDKYEINIKSIVTGNNTYVSLGFSNASAMIPASVVSCVLHNGQAAVTVSYTKGRSNQFLANPKDGISNETNSYVGNLLECTFSRETISDNPQFFNLTDPFYLIAARGAVNAAGSFSYHGHSDRYKTDVKIVLSNVTTDYTFPALTTTTSATTTIITGVSVSTRSTTISTGSTSTPSPNSFSKNPECGKTRGCFSNCNNNKCDLELSWRNAGDKYEINIKSIVTGNNTYVSLGFSNASAMIPASVVSCVLHNGQAAVTVSYTKGRSNQFLANPKDGISNETNSYVGNLLECTFSRETISDNPQFFNLTDPFYLIAARGAVNAAGSFSYHGHSDRYKTDVKIVLSNVTTDYTFPALTTTTSATTTIITGVSVSTRSTTISTGSTSTPSPNSFSKNPECGKTRGCFSNCNNNKCDLELSWRNAGDKYEINIKSIVTGNNTYVSLGFSNASAMSPASVVSCVLHNGQAAVTVSYTKGRSNQLLPNPKDGISNETNSYVGNLLECTFSRETISDNPQFFNLTDPFYLIAARGAVNAAGSFSYHGYSDRYKTDVKVVLSNVTTDYTFPALTTTTSPTTTIITGVSVSTSTTISTGSTSTPSPSGTFPKDPECDKSKGCYTKCDGDLCTLLLSWEEKDSNFEITLKSVFSDTGNHYISLGLAKGSSMNPASVLSCIVYQSTVGVVQSLNNNYDNMPLTNPTEGLSSFTGSYVNGILSCTVLRKALSNNINIYNMTEDWYLIGATGEALSGSNLKIHGIAQAFKTQSKINFTENREHFAGELTFPLVKAHGCLMAVTWIFAASLGLVMARFFKKMWPDSKLCGLKVWFAVHRGAMVATFVMGMAAFAIIFIEVKDYSDIHGEAFKKAHPILGIVVTGLLFINPFMSLLRCGPDHPRRPLFNWAHWLVGTSSHILGGVTIVLGLYLPKASLDADKGLIIMTVYGSWYVVYFLIMTLIDCMSTSKSSKMDTIGAQTLELTDVQPVTLSKISVAVNDNQSQTGLVGFNKRSNGFFTASNEPPYSGVKKLLTLVHFVILLGITASLMYLIINGDI